MDSPAPGVKHPKAKFPMCIVCIWYHLKVLAGQTAKCMTYHPGVTNISIPGYYHPHNTTPGQLGQMLRPKPWYGSPCSDSPEATWVQKSPMWLTPHPSTAKGALQPRSAGIAFPMLLGSDFCGEESIHSTRIFPPRFESNTAAAQHLNWG